MQIDVNGNKLSEDRVTEIIFEGGCVSVSDERGYIVITVEDTEVFLTRSESKSLSMALDLADHHNMFRDLKGVKNDPE